MNKRITIVCMLLGVVITTTAQTELRTETQVTASVGDHSPLWLNANRYGLSSIERNSGYLRAGIFHEADSNRTRQWRWGYGADVAVAANFTSTLVVQQAYADLHWKKVRMTVGSKQQPMVHKNQELSSGSQTFGINARPIPQVRFDLDWWTIPYTRGWVAFRGYGSYGMTTDDGWQKDFTQGHDRRTEHTFFHTKGGYLRFGPKNITFELGLEMGCQFGGTVYDHVSAPKIENDKGFKAFLNALTAQGTDKTDGNYLNSEGNHVGSWVAKLNIDQEKWNLGLYADQFFEDNSMMVHIAYNGYGSGDEAFQRKQSRYFCYDFRDGLVGAELKLKAFPWVNDFVVEYLHTKYQGGPVYHDITKTDGEHITGLDDYYNHHLFTGWQHWGMVMGNPLYLSPIYNTDHTIMVKDNRFWAWHFGVSGDPLPGLHYRLLTSVQRGFGTYYAIYPEPRNNVSMLAEAAYHFPATSPWAGWHVKGALGMDRGELMGDNLGIQLTVGRSLWLNKNGKENRP